MSKIFDLNDSKFDGTTTSIFNNGVPGAVENCKFKVERTKQEDKENSKSPDYKLIFTDSSGAEINMGFWYPSEEESEDNIIKFLKKIKHIAHTILGPEYPMPRGSVNQILDVVMKTIREASGTMLLRVFTNYGTKGYDKKYISVRNFVPFMEPMSVPKSESRLKPSNIEVMEKPAAEEVSSPSSPFKEDWD